MPKNQPLGDDELRAHLTGTPEHGQYRGLSSDERQKVLAQSGVQTALQVAERYSQEYRAQVEDNVGQQQLKATVDRYNTSLDKLGRTLHKSVERIESPETSRGFLASMASLSSWAPSLPGTGSSHQRPASGGQSRASGGRRKP
ncbi:hypothetical protein ABT336_20625 [Micromonospora sp. NPDC000207]|uniref:hypothetical protein n=1 Tax=Micromonospora sp. NPDC000207 TaxID=3154246 RepID=UPI00332BB5F8